MMHFTPALPFNPLPCNENTVGSAGCFTGIVTCALTQLIGPY